MTNLYFSFICMPAIRYFKISFVQVYNFFVVLNSYLFFIFTLPIIIGLLRFG